MGPTASGKTAAAVALARALPVELVSVDSTLVYRGLDIGAARPEYPHHLIDIRDPADPYSAAQFLDDLRLLLPQIIARGRLPVLVGGTMLYFRSFVQGINAVPPADPAVRAAVAAEAAARGWPALHAELARVDPLSAARIHPRHAQRLGRALEVFRSSGVPLSQWHAHTPQALAADYRALQIGLWPEPRAMLHARIDRRWQQMLDDGLLDEVRTLYARGGLDPQLPAVRAVGYRQLWAHLAGECTLPEACTRALAATRQLAKRQLTWLRQWPGLCRLYTDNSGRVLRVEGALPGNAPEAGVAVSDWLLNYLGRNPM
jgi:tRNA dimethylallyltransferase